ncbi:MAG: SAM-dependent methyltransferase [Armatimonadota bacterium]|nr:SAM-dependent methyltransferase [Armatimonadota bacterium]
MADHPLIKIVGLGPGGLGGVSQRSLEVLRTARKIYIRTENHPVVAELSDHGILFESFDSLYENAQDFETLYQEIADRIISETAAGDVVYAVPGHPLIGERSVELIIKQAGKLGIEVYIAPSPSFIEAALESLAVSMDKGLKILDALQIEDLTPSLDTPNLIYQVYDLSIASRVKLRLMEFYPDEFEVFVVRKAGTDDVETLKVPLYKLDWMEHDHLTSVYVPGISLELRVES